MGIVYFIKNEDGFIKIGRTTNLKRRLRELNCGVSHELIVEKYFELKHYKKVEKSLHNLYSYYKVRGEWYNITKNMLRDIYNRVELLDLNFQDNGTKF
jgi:predicted GIY-YIG superfamily endonuclease